MIYRNKDISNKELDNIFDNSDISCDNKLAWEFLKSKGAKKRNYSEGIAKIQWSKGYNFVDTNNHILCDEWFEYAADFCCDFARVKKDGKWTYVHRSGLLLNDELYDDAWDFYKGYALIKKGGDYGLLDSHGELSWYTIEEIWDSQEHEFKIEGVDCRGFLPRERSVKYVQRIIDGYQGYTIDRMNEGIINADNVFSSVHWDTHPFIEGFASISDNDKDYYYIGKDGERISYENFKEANAFTNGFGRVKKFGKYNFVDAGGKFLSKIWFYYATSFDLCCGKYAYVEIDNKANYIDTNGELLLKKFVDAVDINIHMVSCNITQIDYLKKHKGHSLLKHDSFLGNVKVFKEGKTYKCVDEEKNIEYYVPGKPLAIYGKYVLYYEDDFLLLLDRETGLKDEVGSTESIMFDENFIFDKEHEHMYLMYRDDIYDITEYYENKLLLRKHISVDDDYSLEEEKESEELTYIKNAVEDLERDAIESLDDVEETLDDIEEKKKALVEKKMRLLQQTGKTDSCIYSVGDHREINPLLLESGKLDLSKESMVNVKLSGLDLRNKKVNPFDPQKIYKKDLSNSNLEGIIFPVTTQFTGVNVCGSKFTCDDNPRTFDINENNFADAIYDETTTLNGVPLTELLDQKISTTRR